MRSRRTIAILGIVLLAGVAGSDARGDEIEELREEIRALEERLRELEAKYAAPEKEPPRVEVEEPEGAGPELAKLEPEADEGELEAAPWDREGVPLPFEHRTVQIRAREIGVSIGGYVKVDLIKDFDFVGDEDQFVTATIPVHGSAEARRDGKARAHARQTRLNLDVTGRTPVGPANAFVEGDFFGGDTELRLRHAYFSVGNLLGGRTWTVFSDVPSLPTTIDFEGPPGTVTNRKALIRWRQPFGKAITAAIALEDPDSDITVQDSTDSPREPLPDAAAHIRYERAWGHLQLGGVLRQIGFETEGGRDDDEIGWGLSFSGRVAFQRKHRLIPSRFWKEDSVMFQAIGGKGVGRYIQDLGGTGSDAAVSPSGNLQVLPAFGGFVAYERWWAKHLWSVATYGYTWVDNSDGQPNRAYHTAQYASGNLIWNLYPRVYVGIEFLYGTRENKDGADGHARRLQLSAMYDFQ